MKPPVAEKGSPVEKPVVEAQPSLEMLRDPAIIELFRALPVLESGRVKPLDTVARVRLKQLSYKEGGIYLSDHAAADGEPLKDPETDKPIVNAKGKPVRLSAMEFLLVSWFRPDIARKIQAFTVDNSDAVIELGLKDKGKRDKYSYEDLVAGRDLLMKKMEEVKGMESKDMTPVQRALTKLGMDVLDFEMTTGHFDFARAPFGSFAATVPAEIAAPGEIGKVKSIVLIPKVAAYLKAHGNNFDPAANPWVNPFVRAMLGGLMSGRQETVLRNFPPADDKTELWDGPGTLMQQAIQEGTIAESGLEVLGLYEDIYRSRLDAGAFKKSVEAFRDAVMKRAGDRHQVGHLNMEVGFRKADYFFWGTILFSAALVFLALSWVAPGSLWGTIARALCWVFVVSASALGTTGIVIRSLIMERPPITTLYETILFISVAGAILALLVELLSRYKGIALAVACIAGTAGLYLSIRFNDMESADNLQVLQAVLITNFWLATHVPCINLGYAAGMLASIFSMVYLSLRAFNIFGVNSGDAKAITRMTYAFVMAGLFLSLVGTVLGGIWANYSWGRFWGWDPKENGALMIVLMNLIILHARLGGYIKEVGFHASNIVLGMIVAFSWFATNQLGVGLHAYGFTDGVWTWLYRFWGLQTAFLALAVFVYFRDRAASKNKLAATVPPPRVPVKA